MRLLLLPLIISALAAADLEISRPARTWEFVDAAGPRAAFFGREDGTLEAWIYPYKILKDLRLRFQIGERRIPAESIARRIVARPGSYTIVYSSDEFEARETLVAPIDAAGLIIRMELNTAHPLRVDLEFTRDYQLIWPASMGTAYGSWSVKDKAFLFGADGRSAAAALAGSELAPAREDYATNYSADTHTVLTLGTLNGRASRTVALAAAENKENALAIAKRLISEAPAYTERAEQHWREYLSHGVQLDLPDADLQRAYDWSKLSVAKGRVSNPLLGGTGLAAGYGPSKGVYRPGFGWFFGRDTFWTSFALTAQGDLAGAREAIEFIAKYQREDGKLPHEISQSASLVDWFKDFPYGYASADATPLFVIAARNYAQASGDVEFVRKQSPALEKAFSFMRSTFDEAGFPRNDGVGHGWIEGGPLLPVRTELYQAGCYVEAVRSMAALARMRGDTVSAATWDREYAEKRRKLNELYWLPNERVYGYAVNRAGTVVNEPSVLATVPMWFGVLDPDKASAMLEKLAAEDHAADWGMRIISSKSAKYGPEGYHYGTVWPLFTGWASVGAYRTHVAESGYANLRANAWLALDGSAGNTTEVLSGWTYSPLSTSSPHQIWSAAMVVSPLMHGLLGVEVDAGARRVAFAPHLPADWPEVAVRRIPLANGTVDLKLQAGAGPLTLEISNHTDTAFDLDFSPAFAPPTRVTAATLDRASVKWTEERNASDWHPRFALHVKPGVSLLRIERSRVFGYSLPWRAPELGAASSNLKLITECWSVKNTHLDLTVSGRAGERYQIHLTGAIEGLLVAGARLLRSDLIVTMPPGDGYVNTTIRLDLHP